MTWWRWFIFYSLSFACWHRVDYFFDDRLNVLLIILIDHIKVGTNTVTLLHLVMMSFGMLAYAMSGYTARHGRSFIKDDRMSEMCSFAYIIFFLSIYSLYLNVEESPLSLTHMYTSEWLITKLLTCENKFTYLKPDIFIRVGIGCNGAFI